MNEFTIFYQHHLWKFIFWTLIYSNKYQRVFHPFNIVHNLIVNLWGATPPRHCWHYHNIAATTISEVLYNVASYFLLYVLFFRSHSHSCLSSFPNFLLFLSRWQVIAMPTLSLSSFIAVTDEPEANNMTPPPTQWHPAETLVATSCD